MAWLSDWTYRKEITLSRASGTVTNYQMELLVGESSGASGEDVDCNAHCLSNFNDIRFTTSDGLTQLDYWIESISGTTPNQLATIWIEFDSIGTGATTFYMYYGNAGASPVSNGYNTFIVFDDFERGVNGDSVGGSWTEVVSSCRISTEQKYGGTRSLKLVGAFVAPYCTIPVTKSDNIAIRYRVYKEDLATTVIAHGDGTNLLYCQTTPAEVVQVFDGAAYVAAGSITKDTWQLMEFRNFIWATPVCDVLENDVSGKAGADISYGSALYNNTVGMQGINSAGYDTWIDNFIVRNYRVTGPAWGSWGTEESGSQLTTSLSDGIKLAESRSNIWSIVRVFTDSIIFEDLFPIHFHVKSLFDGIKLSDSQNSVWSIVRLYTDGIKLSDIKDTEWSIVRTYADAIVLADTSTNLLILNRSLFDGFKLSDIKDTEWSIVRLFTDVINLVEDIDKQELIVLIDAFNLSDAKEQGWITDLVDSIIFNEDRVRGIVYHSGQPITTTEISGAFTEWSGIKRPYDLLIKSFWTKRAKV